MEKILEQVLELLLFLVPVYFSNAIPVILGGGKPLDFGRKFKDGKRILGPGKTISGFAAGILGGTLAGGIVAISYKLPFFDSSMLQFFGAVLLSMGTMVGDTAGSFLKRRFGIGRGKRFFPDSLVFLIFALVFVFPAANQTLYEIWNLVFFFTLTVLLHPLTNAVANRIGLKNVPW